MGSATASNKNDDDPRSLMLRGVAERLGGDNVEFAKPRREDRRRHARRAQAGRNLYANVEFYAGVVMDKAGLPRDLFTPTFASSRVIGWCANILEQAADNRIIRPSAATSARHRRFRVPRLSNGPLVPGVKVEEASAVTDELVAAFARLIPQLSRLGAGADARTALGDRDFAGDRAARGAW